MYSCSDWPGLGQMWSNPGARTIWLKKSQPRKKWLQNVLGIERISISIWLTFGELTLATQRAFATKTRFFYFPKGILFPLFIFEFQGHLKSFNDNRWTFKWQVLLVFVCESKFEIVEEYAIAVSQSFSKYVSTCLM